MYARVARFEGAEPDRLEAQVAEIKQQLASVKAGLPDDAPAEARVLGETIARFVSLVDRKNGTLVGITFCETEDEMRRADETLNQLTPTHGSGRRTSAEIYEVAIDEQLR